MPRNGSGVYSVYTPGNPVVAGTTIDPTVQNNTMTDVATALTNSLASNGETTPTGNLPMGGFKHTGAAAATTTGQYQTYGQAGNFSDLTTSGNTILGSAAGNTLNVGNGGLIKDASGNVGIGRSPTARLDVAAPDDARLVLDGTASNASSGGTVLAYRTGSFVGSFGVSANRLFDSSAYLLIAGAGDVVISSGGLNERLRVKSGGDLVGLGVAISRVKTSTTSRTSTTTPADDPHLVAPLAVGSWSYDLWMPVWGTTTGTQGFKWQTAFSGTATGSIGLTSMVNGSPTSGGTAGLSAATSIGTIDIGTTVTLVGWIRLTGSVVVTIAGNLSLQWAQNASSANATNVGVGAWMNCTKVG